MDKSASGTEFVNAQLLDLKELIDYYASRILAPSYIKIIQPPNKTSYNTGQQIDLTGIVVNAYYADGTLWGTIPVAMLGYDPTNTNDMGPDIHSEVGTRIAKANTFIGRAGIRYWYTKYDDPIIAVFVFDANTPISPNMYNGPVIFGPTLRSTNIFCPNEDKSEEVVGTKLLSNPDIYTYQGYLVRDNNYDSNVEVVSHAFMNNPGGYNTNWPGNLGITISGGKYDVTVSWNRPGDGRTLTDTFKIEVR